MEHTIAYIMSRFPHLPETFILREMSALEDLGWQVALYPLVRQKQSVVHAETLRWLARARFLSTPSALAGLGRTLLQQPRAYAAAAGRGLRETRSSRKLLSRAIVLLPVAAGLARQLRQQGIRHIHAHYATHPAFVAWMVHRLTGISYSLTVHAHDIFVDTAMLATKLRDASFIAAISNYNREHLARVVGPWVREKTHVVHCGIRPEEYQLRQALPGPGERFELLSIGSLQPYKGQRYLVEACGLLRARGIPLRCRIIGAGEEQAALQQHIAAAGLHDCMELVGSLPQEQVARMLPTAHCYVQPSIITPSGKMEGIPVALMEALACELPVVATAISGVPELVRPGQTGRLVAPADPLALADALAEVYANPLAAASIARAGRELVLREFDLRTNVARLAALFEELLRPAPQPLRHTLVPT